MNQQAKVGIAEEDDLADIFGEQTEYAVKGHRKNKEFSAWHRPRKQYVREEQWCTAIDSLIDDIDFDGRSLRYIGLPGNELFDLRTIHELICKPRGLRLRFLGFNNATGVDNDDGFELNLSTVEVMELDRVDGVSKVMPDDFKALGTQNSMAWSSAQKLGHFDIVNVDLCDGLFTAKPAITSDSYYDAIKELINLQSGRGDPWLLFLTTRVGINDVHKNTVEILKDAISNNLENCESFSKATRKHLNFESMDEVDKLLKNQKGFSDIFATGISKWLIKLGLSANPHWKVSLQSVYNYTVYPEAKYPDLLSLSFEFTPIRLPAQDKLGLASKAKAIAPKIPSECSLATEIVPFIANVLNIDEHLSENQGLTEKYIEKSATLFEKARYPSERYRIWLEKNNY